MPVPSIRQYAWLHVKFRTQLPIYILVIVLVADAHAVKPHWTLSPKEKVILQLTYADGLKTISGNIKWLGKGPNQ